MILHLVVSEPGEEAVASECPCCLFDAVLAFPIHWLSDDGVSTFGYWSGCVRCHDKKCPCSPLSNGNDREGSR